VSTSSHSDANLDSSDPLRELYSSFTRELTSQPEMSTDGMRAVFERWHLATAEPLDVTYREAAGSPVPATWCVPLRSSEAAAIVYTHGGGFVVGSRHSHRKLAGHLATYAETPVLVIDYRRAPEHPHPAQVEDTLSVAKWLIETEGFSHRGLALAGDSAGGNIALSAALRLCAEGLGPSGVVALSPWFDMENTGESLATNAEHDAMVNRETLEVMRELVLSGQSPQAPAANPLHADLSSLPPTLLTASSHEALRDDAVRLASLAELAGCDVTLRLEPEAQHVFQMAAGNSTAADQSLAYIGDWLKARYA
jgi:epsilon-lactone hydrolase